MPRHILKQVLLCACMLSPAFAADAFPRVSGETLEGKTILLPDAIKGTSTLLIVSFSRAAAAQTRAWGEKLKQQQPALSRYQVLELEDVPRLFRGFVKSGIRKSIPDAQSHFVLLFEGQDSLKKFVNYQESDDAYVLLLDTNGNVMAQQHGAVNDQKLGALTKELTKK